MIREKNLRVLFSILKLRNINELSDKANNNYGKIKA